MPRERRPKLYKPYFITPSTDELHWGNINPVTLQHPGTSTAKRWGKWSLILTWDYKCPETSNQPREDSNLGWVVVSQEQTPWHSKHEYLVIFWRERGGGLGEFPGDFVQRGWQSSPVGLLAVAGFLQFSSLSVLVGFSLFLEVSGDSVLVVATVFTMWIRLHF